MRSIEESESKPQAPNLEQRIVSGCPFWYNEGHKFWPNHMRFPLDNWSVVIDYWLLIYCRWSMNDDWRMRERLIEMTMWLKEKTWLNFPLHNGSRELKRIEWFIEENGREGEHLRYCHWNSWYTMNRVIDLPMQRLKESKLTLILLLPIRRAL